MLAFRWRIVTKMSDPLLLNVHNECCRPGVIIDPWVDPDLVISTEKDLLWRSVGVKNSN